MKIGTHYRINPTYLLSVVFFCSGFAALVYQVVWQRLLTVYYGVGTISITLIVSVYMLGLGLGALWGGALAERVRKKVFLYFLVELLLGCFGMVSLPLLDFLGRHTAGSNLFVSFCCMLAFLFLPTFLMGITLPLLTKIFNRFIQNFLDSVSFLYFINTLGAAIGAVCGSYILISFFGLDVSIYSAATINVTLAALILFFSYRMGGDQNIIQLSLPGSAQRSPLGRAAYGAVFITGFLAIGYEIAWFRVVGVLVKDSPYAFSSVLAVYLAGLAFGSFAMSKYIKYYPDTRHRDLFFFLQGCISLYVIAIFTGYYYLTRYSALRVFTLASFNRTLHPDFMFVSFDSLRESFLSLYAFADVFFWPVLFVLLPTIFMGASFPLISFLALSDQNKEGKTVGTVYCFNILGNVLGGVVTGLMLLPYLKTENTLLLFSLVGMLFLLLIGSSLSKPHFIKQKIVLVLLLLGSSILVFPRTGRLYETIHTSPGIKFTGYLEEGIDGIIMTYQHDDKIVNYINGLGHGGRPGTVFYYEALLAASYAQSIDNVLVIGYGTGSFVEVVLKSDAVKTLTLVEINRTLIKNLCKMDLFENMLSDSRVNLIFDDGRRYLLNTRDTFDLILMDPLRSTTSYSNNLYSREFLEILKQHLNPGGIALLYIDENRVLPKTIAGSFDFVQMFQKCCLASSSTLTINPKRQQQLMGLFSPDEQKALALVAQTVRAYRGDQEYIKKVTKQYPINDDWNPVCEYYIGLKIKERFLYNK